VFLLFTYIQNFFIARQAVIVLRKSTLLGLYSAFRFGLTRLYERQESKLAMELYDESKGVVLIELARFIHKYLRPKCCKETLFQQLIPEIKQNRLGISSNYAYLFNRIALAANKNHNIKRYNAYIVTILPEKKDSITHFPYMRFIGIVHHRFSDTVILMDEFNIYNLYSKRELEEYIKYAYGPKAVYSCIKNLSKPCELEDIFVDWRLERRLRKCWMTKYYSCVNQKI